ncbi:MAG: IS1595 family transposase [Methylovirgula sp.]
MSKSVLDAKALHDETAAYAWVEARLWPNGPTCPHCGGVTRISKMQGKSTRIGAYKCYQCRKQFTVKVGTVFEDSHVPMNLWLQAVYLMCSSKKGISSNQLHRTLGVTLKTAWFMSHRLREAMRVTGIEPMGGLGSTIEIDETVIGRIEGAPKSTGKMGGRSGFRNVALTLVERGGSARSFHVTGTTIGELKPIIRANIARETAIMTDQAAWYPEIAREFASHDSVNHVREEYVRYEGEKMVTTNAVEGYYSIFKRGMKGVYQHCAEKHLHRYLSEFDFRYSNRVRLGIDDVQRTELAIKGIVGKRLTYRTTHH